MTKNIINAQIKAYQPAILEHGDSPMSTHWSNRETQYLRFRILTENLLSDHVHNTIEDIGCGICDLYSYLRNMPCKFTYSGTEIVDEMIVLSKVKYPEITVKNRDIVSEIVSDKYDFVVSSGVFNMPGNVESEEWKSFCLSMIKSMYTMCNKAIAFNFLTSHRTFSDTTLFYFDPAELFDFCVKNLSRFVEVKHNYPLYEGTITVYREAYVQEHFRDPAFAKYFRV